MSMGFACKLLHSARGSVELFVKADRLWWCLQALLVSCYMQSGILWSPPPSRPSVGPSSAPAMTSWALQPLAAGRRWPLGFLRCSTSGRRRLLESLQVRTAGSRKVLALELAALQPHRDGKQVRCLRHFLGGSLQLPGDNSIAPKQAFCTAVL